MIRRITYKFMTEAHKEFFDKKGYAVFKGYLNQSQCKSAIGRIDQIIEQKTQNETKQKFFLDVTEKQLIDSATTVQLFYQKQSFKDGKFIRDKKKCVNKIAHNLHQLETIFKNITYKPKAIDILKGLGFIKPVVTQSMAILKVPYDGASVSIHQDSTYLITEPDTLLAFWIPLEKCTVQNGCLQGIADKRQTVLYEQIRHNKKTQLAKSPDWSAKQWQKIEMDPGDLVIFDGKFVHKSGTNTSTKSRYAYTWHLFDSGKSKWVDGNWIPNRNFLSYY